MTPSTPIRIKRTTSWRALNQPPSNSEKTAKFGWAGFISPASPQYLARTSPQETRTAHRFSFSYPLHILHGKCGYGTRIISPVLYQSSNQIKSQDCLYCLCSAYNQPPYKPRKRCSATINIVKSTVPTRRKSANKGSNCVT